jgi:hypothetical protein
MFLIGVAAALGLIPVKGLGEPIEAFELTGALSAPHPHAGERCASHWQLSNVLHGLRQTCRY